ncbi:hypothetical protein [Streptacidiphilus pinicola]|uniref:hypothetical protein n=1 Tax=Streptacidiphilus pinicola TaxID=2219663 RepID=UPI001057AF3A|nr:hypothetical protein [Streptacidiphilus pinicola]
MTTSDSARAVDAALQHLDAAVAQDSPDQLESVYRELTDLPAATLDAHTTRLGPHIARQLALMPAWHAAAFADLVGQLVDVGADALVCAPPLLRGLRESLLRAQEFFGLWWDRFGPAEEPPEPGSVPDPDLQARLGDSYADVWHAPYLGWLALHRWSTAAVPVLADGRVRLLLRDGDDGIPGLGADANRLARLAEWLLPRYESRFLGLVVRLLRLLEDAPLLVVHPAARKAFVVRIDGMTHLAQLQMPLSVALYGGGHLPGSSDVAAAFAGAAAERPSVPSRLALYEDFAFARPDGARLWPSVAPDELPVVDGVRRLVLHDRQEFVPLQWGPLLERLPERLEVLAVLDGEEARRACAGVAPLRKD